MSKVSVIVTGIAIVLSTFVAPREARADSTFSGKAYQIDSVTDDSDQTYRGLIWVQPTSGTMIAFKWGGTDCAGYAMPSVTQIEQMTTAVANGLSITVLYKSTLTLNCLVGFRIKAP